MARPQPIGPNRAAALDALAAIDVTPSGRPLAELLLTLADQLDDNPGAQLHNVAREYRLVLDKLRELHPTPGEPDELDRFLSDLGVAQ